MVALTRYNTADLATRAGFEPATSRLEGEMSPVQISRVGQICGIIAQAPPCQNSHTVAQLPHIGGRFPS